MKKTLFALFIVTAFVFLFASCGLTEKPELTISDSVNILKNDDQGEDEGNRKNPPVANPLNENDQGEDEGNGKKPPIIEKPIDEEKPPIEDLTEIDNLLEKYGLNLMVVLNNDYMPPTPVEGRRFSAFSVVFDSPVEIPPMELFATVKTERITIPVLFYDVYNGKGTHSAEGLFRVHYMAVNPFRLEDWEEYTVELTVKILGEQQTITQKKKVTVTW